MVRRMTKEQSTYSDMLMCHVLLIMLVWNVRGDPICPWGTYGDSCDRNCSEHCSVFPGRNIVHCDRASGRCSEGCIPGWYDATCNKECSKNCINNICNHGDGACTAGCKDGKTGTFCEEEQLNTKAKESTADLSWMSIAVAATVPIIIIIMICAVVVYWHQKYWKRQRFMAVKTWNTQDLEGLLNTPVPNEPLHKASAEGDLDRVKQIMSCGLKNVNTRGLYGLTPLMLAAQNGHYDVFEYLHTEGADMTLTDRDGDHILSMACVGGNIDIVKYVVLKEPFLNINRGRTDGRTALMWAARHGNKTMFDYLLEKGANCSSEDIEGDNVLHYACYGGHIGIVMDVIANTTIDINSSDVYGRTAMMVAAEHGHIEVFDFLVRKGCDISHKDKEGSNILHVTCRGGHVKMAEHVLSRGDFDINCKGQCGRTPLILAAFYGHRDVCDLIYGKEADVSQVDNKGNNILHVACMGGHLGMVQYILSQDIADINSHGQDGRTPLMLATQWEQRAVFKLLMHEGADLSQVDKKGNNVLHLASKIGSMEIVQHVLRENTLDINAGNGRGETAAMIAKREDHMKLYELLVSKGANAVTNPRLQKQKLRC
ncbi:ankyrin repeat domain-containing protein 50-like isoform X2 [Haliotis rufescens]|uniref:ankyrin repeat domain-containing protein 50-like isoform X2 n=1 Tax=Haliotis rufescens TaxID=6454 RepID=UPI00201F0E5B|nr:ankyrin repeat domain-containing protein 50-like isoform X2 [Haliotis rufescens]